MKQQRRRAYDRSEMRDIRALRRAGIISEWTSRRRRASAAALAALVAGTIAAAPSAQDMRTLWTTPQTPFRIFGNTYYIGTRGISVILVTSDAGHVLIDGALPESAGAIAASVKKLGFRLEDVKLILNSHAHFDHAGGIGPLQRMTGATVAATPWSAQVFESGKSDRADPQFGGLEDIATVTKVRRIKDGEEIRQGPLLLTAHANGGHTPGGTTWTWKSCEGTRCLDLVYADSLSPISADGFLFTRSKDYPNAISDFEKAFAFLASAPCDVLLTPHPEASDLWSRLAKRDKGDPNGMVDGTACRRLVDGARERLRKRLADEKKAG
jgi:metallo-beta-lactamase class B